MLRFKLLLLVAAAALIAAQPMLASDLQVGTCKGKLKSYATISDAVSTAPSGSTIYVCAGTYPEQVTINQPLNLIGAPAATADQVLITVPSGGLRVNTASMFGQTVAAQLIVEGAGPVNITNLTVDGTGGDLGCLTNTWVAGIFYGSASSGTINRVRASNQTDAACGVGIWAENANTSSQQNVTIENSTVYNSDGAGVFLGSRATLSVDVNNNNVVNPAGQGYGIVAQGVTGTVQANDVSKGAVGIFDVGPALTMRGNTILASGFGILLLDGGTASYNRVSGANIGIFLGAGGATLTGNRIMSSTGQAVEMGCFAATVSGNVVNDALIGVAQVPSSGIGTNSFANTATTTTSGCVAAAIMQRGMGVNSAAQWHTPATPFGTRTN